MKDESNFPPPSSFLLPDICSEISASQFSTSVAAVAYDASDEASPEG